MFTNYLLKAIASIFLLAFISLATGCTNDEEYIPKLAKHAVRFTDNEEIEPGQPEVINIDAQQQTIVLTVKNSEMASLKMKYYTVGEWDEKNKIGSLSGTATTETPMVSITTSLPMNPTAVLKSK